MAELFRASSLLLPEAVAAAVPSSRSAARTRVLPRTRSLALRVDPTIAAAAPQGQRAVENNQSTQRLTVGCGPGGKR